MAASELLSIAEQQAKKDGKCVMVIFHASWCGWCHKLDAMLTNAEIGPKIASAFVVVHLDVDEKDAKKSLENPGAGKVRTELGGDTAGLPFFAILSPEGKSLGTSIAPKTGNIGFPSEPGEVTYFMSLLDKTAPKLKDADRARIEQYLRTPVKQVPTHG